MSSTSDPESDDVMKKTTSTSVAKTPVTTLSGRASSRTKMDADTSSRLAS